jgi:hypothetical protein
MNVQMEYGLSPIAAGVDDGAIAVGESELLGDRLHFNHQVPHEGMIGGGDFRQAGNGLFGDQEDMGGGLGVDVPEGKAQIIFINNVSGDFPADDLGKQGVAHGERRGIETIAHCSPGVKQGDLELTPSRDSPRSPPKVPIPA